MPKTYDMNLRHHCPLAYPCSCSSSVFFKTLANFARRNLCWSLFLIKLEFWEPGNFLRKTPIQVFYCEIYKLFRTTILKNICKPLLLSIILKETQTRVFSCEFCKLLKNSYFLEDIRMACSQTPVRGVFNKVTNLTARKILTVLERDCRTGISLWILRNFSESFFRRTPLSNHFSHDAASFPFCRLVRFAA